MNALLDECVGCGEAVMVAAADSLFVPVRGAPIDCSLCRLCRDRLPFDKPLQQLIELRLLLRATSP
jgi:hypothetical protein